jgi:phenylalanyl-tRNA synthetase beta chain
VPKIEVNRDIFFHHIGKKLTTTELVDLLECAKAELDEVNEELGILKIELNDTNRPDLWSTMGLARQLRSYLGGKRGTYQFFSLLSEKKGKEDKTADKKPKTDKRVIVEKNLQSIRPYIAAFIATGPAIDEPHLVDIIQSQEKLCGNYGSKRKSIAMGVYRSDIISYPIHYRGADPDKTRFMPLGMDKELSLREILDQHPKGIEFGGIVRDFKYFPFLTDDKNEVLSFPPIINSARIGAVEVGDTNLFIELTGTDIDTLLLACSIMACDLADAGYAIQPVTVEYPYDTSYGREITTPFYFQKPVRLDLDDATRLLGEPVSAAVALSCIERMGNTAKAEKESVTLVPPVFRNDFMHPVDVIEEIMMGRGLKSFSPLLPEEFTVGRLTPEEEFSRKARDVMVGLGFQEMIYNYLGSKKDFVEKMQLDDSDIIEITNPMTENYEIVRNSILPNLLGSEAISGNAVYPHKIFEAGKIVRKDKNENYGSSTRNCLAFLVADREAGFNEINAEVSGLLFYLSREYTLSPLDDVRFIKGRSAEIIYRSKRVGMMGEIHPRILEIWGIQMPCIAAEIDLDLLMSR